MSTRGFTQPEWSPSTCSKYVKHAWLTLESKTHVCIGSKIDTDDDTLPLQMMSALDGARHDGQVVRRRHRRGRPSRARFVSSLPWHDE